MTRLITRREAFRRTVFFSTAALAGARTRLLRATPAHTSFASHGIHLLALGDYGSKGDANQTAVAKAMKTFAASLDRPLAAVLALGDNFYGKITPERFRTHFESLYSPETLDCPFYVVAGNHDYGTAVYDKQDGKLQMQLDYARNNPRSRWKMPAKWYTVELPDATRPLVKMIVLDGNFWLGGLTPQEKIEQRRFVEREVNQDTAAPWLWMLNHFPLFSECKPRSVKDVRGDNDRLIREWDPWLRRSRVSLCLAGHDHTMQHLRVEGFNASFVVAGAGGQRLNDVAPSTRGYVNDECFGFTHIHVTPEQLDVQFINTSGECLHRFRRTPRGDVTILS